MTGATFLCLAALMLTGCMGAGLDLAASADIDKSLATGSIPRAVDDENPDATTIRNAVTSADLATVPINPIPWANARSGSAGVIGSISEEQVNGVPCRRFTTTRHSYQGIAQFDGNACQLGNGDWVLTSFGRRS
jgi:hypothetical protein